MAIDTVSAVNNRVHRLREKLLVTPSICIERGYWMTESYKETEADPFVLRKAKALQKVLENMTIFIDEGQLIVGNATSKNRGGAILPELQWEWYLKEMDSIASRPYDPFKALSEEEKTKMREFLPWWKGKSAIDKWHALLPDEALKLSHFIMAGGAYCLNNMYYGHVSFDFEKVLQKGLNGIQLEVDEALSKLNLADVEDLQKYEFLKAVNITIEAAKKFAGRYAQLARDQAARETDPVRKSELLKMAEILEWVPANPARSFWEALQSAWLVYIVVIIEDWSSYTMGRPDQYLFPYYQKDLNEGKITREEAKELLALLLIKPNEFVTPRPSSVIHFFAGYPTSMNTTIGGVDEKGEDAVNELSYLFLEAEMDVRLTHDDFVVRINKKTPDAFVMKAAQVAKALNGKIKFLSDETTIKQLVTDGKPLEWARNYIVTGCFCPTVPGCSLDIPGGTVNMPLMMELALNDGKSRITGEQIGPRTGDPRKFKSYEEVWEAYKKQVEAVIPIILLFKNADKYVYATYVPTPFQSALFKNCIERGLDVTNGGTYPFISHGIALSGAPNVGDSLAAIKRVVFENKQLTMGQVIDALDRNFEGNEKILRVLEQAPKFGNDDDYVDNIVNDVLAHASGEAAKTRGFTGAISTASASSGPSAIPLGTQVGALPDGRKAGEPISEGGISPHQGRNICGPTATLKSVAKLDHTKFTNGSVLNMKFNPDAVKNEQKMQKFVSLIRTYCETGGGLVQFNIVSSDTLRDAQRHPENYHDLLVRVATYSAYFVELGPEAQDNIIARTEFDEV